MRIDLLIFKILEARQTVGKDFAVFSLNILRFPSFQSCLVLPQNVKDTCAGRLKHILLWDLHEFERGQVTRLIEYLHTVEKPHNEAFEMPKLHNDFKQFYQQYDVRRNKNFETTFPELKDWFNTL